MIVPRQLTIVDDHENNRELMSQLGGFQRHIYESQQLTADCKRVLSLDLSRTRKHFRHSAILEQLRDGFAHKVGAHTSSL